MDRVIGEQIGEIISVVTGCNQIFPIITQTASPRILRKTDIAKVYDVQVLGLWNIGASNLHGLV